MLTSTYIPSSKELLLSLLISALHSIDFVEGLIDFPIEATVAVKVFDLLSVGYDCYHSAVSSKLVGANGLRLCVVADFQHKSSIEELHFG